MELEKRFTIADSFVTILCLLGFLYSISLFNGVLNLSLDKLNEAPIGTITFKYKSAQRKLIDRVLWDRIKQNSPVYNGDIIRTAELSEATITFADGNVIELYEQTLAQVFLDLEVGTAIDFSGGGVSVNTSASETGMTLTSGNANVQVSAGAVLSASASLNDGETASPLLLQLREGQADLYTDENTDTVSLTEGSGLVFDGESNSFILPSVNVLYPPANVKYITQSETAVIPFSWQKENVDSNEYLILETSKNRNFENLVEQISFTNVSNISLNMEEGTWYWRLYTESQSAIVSGKIQVVSSPSPMNTVPAVGSEYSYRTKTPQVRFLWNDDENARSWLFEVSENEQMENPLISQTTIQPSAILNTLEDGRYYWRVKPQYSQSLQGQDSLALLYSNVSYFDIIEQGELTQAELTLPLNGGFIDATNTVAGHYFSWKYDYEADGYEIVISKNESLLSPIVKEVINENYFVVHSDVAELNEGEWFWAVRKIDSEGNYAKQSDVHTFFSVQGKIEQRTLFPPDGYTVAENLVLDTTFTWKSNLPFAMNFQIASDIHFDNVLIDRQAASASISGLSIPVGTWYWRIIAESDETGIIYETEPKEFSVSAYLEKVFVSDVSTELPVVVRPSVPMDFSWEAVENADYYQVRLYKEDNRDVVVYEDLFVESTSINIDMDDFEEGNYALTLRAMASETSSSSRQTGLLSEQHFNMEKLVPITLLIPSDGYVLDGVEALRNPPVVEWDTVEAPYASRLVVSSSNYGMSLAAQASGRQPLEQHIYYTVENPDQSLQLKSLPAGTWYWTIIAETEEGFDITPIEPSRIVVKAIEPFDAPRVINPPSSITLNMNYLRQQRYIDFNWESFNEADGYILTILNEDKRVLLEKIIDNDTSYRFENLALLGRGNFSWTLEAIQRIDNSIIVRRGKKEERDIVIDIPTLRAPTEQTTGELYGL